MSFFRNLMRMPLMETLRWANIRDEFSHVILPDFTLVHMNENSLEFRDYPFDVSVAAIARKIPASEIINVDLWSSPPTLLVKNELIAISSEQKDSLKEWTAHQGIPLVKRPLIWNFILEPFLDTVINQSDHDRMFKYLNAYGISEEETNSWRNFLSTPMIQYNFESLIWDWVDLNLFDALAAIQPHCNSAQFSCLYETMMQMALLEKSDHD